MSSSSEATDVTTVRAILRSSTTKGRTCCKVDRNRLIPSSMSGAVASAVSCTRGSTLGTPCCVLKLRRPATISSPFGDTNGRSIRRKFVIRFTMEFTLSATEFCSLLEVCENWKQSCSNCCDVREALLASHPAKRKLSLCARTPELTRRAASGSSVPCSRALRPYTLVNVFVFEISKTSAAASHLLRRFTASDCSSSGKPSAYQNSSLVTRSTADSREALPSRAIARTTRFPTRWPSRASCASTSAVKFMGKLPFVSACDTQSTFVLFLPHTSSK
mmetsp:Transcript_8300/g.23050  ORF Transcript_8300/g.23050 Transcript_8300/m.23050 type:complete len:275 (-) Transcript_8300:1016-1840(-)